MSKIKGHNYAETLFGGTASDVITGMGGNDSLYGQGGDDTIDGGSGDDAIDGGSGSDKLYGGGGNDWFELDEGRDTVDGGSGRDSLSASSLNKNVSITVDGTAQTVTFETKHGLQTTTFKNIEFIWGSGYDDTMSASDKGGPLLFGFFGDDILTGGTADDTLDGGDGDDILTGNAGDDSLSLNGGNDSLDGGEGHDFIDLSGLETAVDYSIGQTVLEYESYGDAWTATLISIENVWGSAGDDTFDGDDGVNVLIGWNGDDTISGHGGDDVISGGAGNDTLTGGAGKDFFVFAHMDVATGQEDVITDFIAGDDSILLDGEKFWSLVGKGKSHHLGFYDYRSLQASQFQSSEDDFAHGKKIRLFYEEDTGTLYYDHDGSKNKINAIEVAHFDPGTELTAADLFVGTAF